LQPRLREPVRGAAVRGGDRVSAPRRPLRRAHGPRAGRDRRRGPAPLRGAGRGRRCAAGARRRRGRLARAMVGSDVLDRVYAVIRERARERPAGSYVVQLLDGGVPGIGAKVREESAELLEAAAGRPDPAHVAHEAADLLFHVWVLLGALDVEPARIYAELERRFGVGGLTEK